MKLFVTLALGICLCCFAVMAEEFSGTISDSHCAAKDAGKAATAGHADCAVSCIKGGAQAVLVTPAGKVYKLEPQDKVVPHAGHKVTISGKLDGDAITVDSVKM